MIEEITDYSNIDALEIAFKWDTTKWDNDHIAAYAALINTIEAILEDDWYNRSEDERSVCWFAELNVGLECQTAPQVFKRYDLVIGSINRALLSEMPGEYMGDRKAYEKWDSNPQRPMYEIIGILKEATRVVKWA